MDVDVVGYFRREFSLQVGPQSRAQVEQLLEAGERDATFVQGRDLVTGLPRVIYLRVAPRQR